MFLQKSERASEFSIKLKHGEKMHIKKTKSEKTKQIGGAAKITDFWHLLVDKLGGNEK